MFWLFGFQACGILVPQPGVEPTPSALEVEVLTPGPPGKSHQQCHSYQSTFQRLTKMGLLEMADIPERWSKKHCVNCWFSDAPLEDQVASQQLCTLGPGCPGCTQMRLVFSIMVLLSLGEPKRTGWEQNIAVYFFSFSVKQCSFQFRGPLFFYHIIPTSSWLVNWPWFWLLPPPSIFHIESSF